MPHSVAIDASGNIIVADIGVDTIFRISPDCNNACAPVIIKKGPPLQDPLGVAVDPVTGDVIVADFYVRTIFRIQADCNDICEPTALASSPQLWGPVAVVVVPSSTVIPEFPFAPMVVTAALTVSMLAFRLQLWHFRRTPD